MNEIPNFGAYRNSASKDAHYVFARQKLEVLFIIKPLETVFFFNILHVVFPRGDWYTTFVFHGIHMYTLKEMYSRTEY